MVRISSAVRRISTVVGVSCAVFAAGGASVASADAGDPGGGDPVFGEGCRYVAVDTPTDVDPHATVCRPL
jgi:hypothetical protein